MNSSLSLYLTRCIHGPTADIFISVDPDDVTDYKEQGRTLAMVLSASLPSGTYDAMLDALSIRACHKQPHTLTDEPAGYVAQTEELRYGSNNRRV